MIRYLNKTAKDATMRTLDEFTSGCWVCVEEPSAQELTELVQKFNISTTHINDALDANMVPRLESVDQQVYLYVRYPQLVDGTLITRPVLYVQSKKAFITISAYRVPAFERCIKGEVACDTTDRTRLGLALFGEIGHDYEQSIMRIAKDIEAIRTKLRNQAVNDSDFVKFVVLEGELNDFATVMRSTAVTLRSMRGHATAFTDYKKELQQLVLANQQAVDNCELYERAINAIRDAYATLSSNRLNQTMKVLTIATLFVALPTSVYSMYGMNVPLPIQNEPWAFALVFALSLGIPAAVLWLVHRRRLL